MIRHVGIALFLALGSLTRAEETAADLSLRGAVDLMLSERESREALEDAIDRARKLGASDQSVLEARFLFSVDRRDDSVIADLAPQFLARKDSFKIEDSEIFGVREDWLAVVEYTQAIACLKKQDKAGFKQHITEAFWLSPRQGAAFAPHIERLRLNEAMKDLKVDFSTALETLDGTTTTPRDVLGDRKALFLHFFSPWSRECEESLPDFIKLATSLEKAGVAVMTIIGEPDADTRADTDALLSSLKSKPAGTWVTDRTQRPLSVALRVQSAPTMVLVDLDGSILFNGHPSERELWDAIGKVAPEFERPASAPTH